MNKISPIQIDDRTIGPGLDVYLIAEVGLAHDGSLGTAHAYIDAAATCMVDAIKFQTHIAEAESTPLEPFRVKVFPQDATRFDYWKRTGFEKSQWLELAHHARQAGLTFLSSPFSELAIDWLMECQVPVWKVASGELTNFPLLQRMVETGKPLLLSSGMSGWPELDAAVAWIESLGGEFAVFQCTTSYPCPPESWGLNVLGELQSRYHRPVGLSDHSGSIVPGIAAAALGASLLEFHVAFSKLQFGPDAKASLTWDQVVQLVEGVRALDRAKKNPVDKNVQAEKLAPLHQLFTKSVVAARPLPRGTVLQSSDLAFKKPGIGIPANASDRIVGKTLIHDVPADHFFTESDFDSLHPADQSVATSDARN